MKIIIYFFYLCFSMHKGLSFTASEIVIGLKKSDSKVTTYVYEKSYPLILSLVNKNKSITVDARDLLHEGMIALYENSCKLDFELTCEITTYMYSICRNLLYSKTKKQSSIVDLKDVHEYEEVDILNQKELNSQELYILSLLETIGNSCKKILELFYFESLKMNEIAEKLEYTNADNVKNQKYKCIKKLKSMASKNSSNV